MAEAKGVANLFNILDTEVVIVSGGLVKGKPWFVADVERRVEQMLHFGSLRKPCVQLASAGDQAGILGAAVAVFNTQEEVHFY